MGCLYIKDLTENELHVITLCFCKGYNLEFLNLIKQMVVIECSKEDIYDCIFDINKFYCYN